MAYDQLAERAYVGFEQRAIRARRERDAAGARFVPRERLEGCRDAALQAVVGILDDAGLIAAFSSRPGMLDLDERIHPTGGGLRSDMRQVLILNLSDGLDQSVDAILAEGQDIDSLPDAVASALATLDGPGAGGPYPLADAAREILEAGVWDVRAKALAVHLASFLEDAGHGIVGGDLRAAADAREGVEERGTGPAPR